MRLSLAESVAAIPAAAWDGLLAQVGEATPFLRHAYLAALEQSGSATPATGWTPRFLLAHRDDRLAGALPLYLKTHSWGEFVFDWAWAEAYQRHGLAYYPKLIAAVPFTPVAGPRLLATDAASRRALADAALALARELGVSSLHLLFPREAEARELEAAGCMLRRNVQFHWNNPGYRDFNDYLADLRQDKRKKVRQERRQVAAAGIRCERLAGPEIRETHWRHFMACYLRTHETHHAPPSLNLDFFLALAATMPENLLLVLALRDDMPIAAALDFQDDHALYGRSWGTLEYHPGLHFETCYYQGIEHCIQLGLKTFEGGAQGEHKHARGFTPTPTWSAHWLAEPRFAGAVADFLRREHGGVERYLDELEQRTALRRVAR